MLARLEHLPPASLPLPSPPPPPTLLCEKGWPVKALLRRAEPHSLSGRDLTQLSPPPASLPPDGKLLLFRQHVVLQALLLERHSLPSSTFPSSGA